MARQPRIQYEGAIYHVMARGDRQEAIFEDGADREMFLATLAEVCERSGWKVYAWVLLSNHYHLVLQTPAANLVAGMKWFQNTYTRRLNTRHRKWGHVFGGRYKAIVVQEDDDYLGSLIDYVHLNPVRARLVKLEKGQGLLAYEWSSLARGYGLEARKRPAWQAVTEGLDVFGYRDTARDRRAFIERLEKRGREDRGEVHDEDRGLQNTLQRGWYWGGQAFREKLLKMVRKLGGNRNYRSSDLGRQKDRRDAEEWLKLAARHFNVPGDLPDAPRAVRLAAAWAIHRSTNQPQAWIAERLGLRSPANVSQQVRRADQGLSPSLNRHPRWKSWQNFVRNH